MDLQARCLRGFMKCVNSTQMNPDQKSGVLSHENKNLFLKNMQSELNKIRMRRLQLGKRPLNEMELDWAIKSMTDLFIYASIKDYEHRIKSSAQKTLEKTKIDEIKDLESTLAGKPSGDYADIVMAVGDGDALERLNADKL